MARPRSRPSSRNAAEALARTAPLVSRWIERLLAAHDPALTIAQYLVLQAVREGDVVASELARRAAVSPAAVSQLLTALEDGGLLERRRMADDRRRLPLSLTAHGHSTVRSAQHLLRDRLAELLVDLPPRESDALARLLTRLDASLGGTAPPHRPRRPLPPSPRRRRPKP